ncbi:MAG: DUF1134 domain-containing protein [Solimonas sp.]
MTKQQKTWRAGAGCALALAAGLLAVQPATGQSDGPTPAKGDIRAPAVEEGAPPPPSDEAHTYSADEVTQAASKFFGSTSEGLAKAIERTFSDYGRPNAYIYGNEGGGAIVVGLRYGKGTLQFKGGESQKVYWQGPSVGWDFGGNASKVFTLVYNLRSSTQLFQRFPAVDGSLYVVAGVGVNYQKSGDIVLAPIRTGVGLRAGASLGYVHYTREASVVPL